MPIRRLTPDDAVPYRALMLEAYALHPEAFTSSVAERAGLPIAWWRERLAQVPSPNEVVLGVFGQEGLTGVVGLSFETREKARHKASLFGMYVAERHRRHGLGAQLLAEALRYARSRPGLKLLQLTVTQGNRAAQQLYTDFGFVEFGVEPYAVAVGTGFVAKVHMWRELESVSAGR